jgi:hypothetical protein
MLVIASIASATNKVTLIVAYDSTSVTLLALVIFITEDFLFLIHADFVLSVGRSFLIRTVSRA